ncbi:MAG: CapA family protein [Butyrivibrio sp.]|nr:CapA family protein [Butyrivibrio sp.]
MSTIQLFKILCNRMSRKINKRSISRIMPFFILLSAFAMPITSFAKAGKSMDKEITIVMVGDILLHTPVEEAAIDDAGNYNFDFIFEDTKKDIASADIAIVNQEVIIGGEELGVSGYPAFNAPTEIGDALVKAGFDVVCHGTNHALDKGKKGILNTLDYWEENHPEITILGINDSKEDQENITIIEQDGIKIALLNYTYGTNGISLPKGMPYAVDMLDKDKVISDLKYAEENADFTIVCPHWGTEYELGTDSSQKKWAKIFREYGADLVIGTHPHVIEPIEMMEDGKTGYSNNHGNGDMLVYYSLGNFVNWTSGKGKGVANRMVGGMAQISIGLDKNGEVVIKDYGVEALVCHVKSGDRNIRVCPLSSYSETMGLENEIRKQDSTFSTQYCIDLVNNIWNKLWR